MMDIQLALSYNRWMKKHPRILSKYAGQWIALRPNGQFIGHSDDAQDLYFLTQQNYPKEIPFIYKIPRADEGPYVL